MRLKYRMTEEIIRAGQPRAYADTEYVCQVSFEHTSFQNPNDFVPFYMDKEDAFRKLKHVNGFVERRRNERREGETHMDADFATYLDYVKPINPTTADKIIDGGDPSQELASIWE